MMKKTLSTQVISRPSSFGREISGLRFLAALEMTVFVYSFYCFADIKTLWACPFCADVVARGKDAMQALRFGTGISWSLAAMLGVPFTLVSGIALFLYIASRKQAKRNLL